MSRKKLRRPQAGQAFFVWVRISARSQRQRSSSPSNPPRQADFRHVSTERVATRPHWVTPSPPTSRSTASCSGASVVRASSSSRARPTAGLPAARADGPPFRAHCAAATGRRHARSSCKRSRSRRGRRRCSCERRHWCPGRKEVPRDWRPCFGGCLIREALCVILHLTYHSSRHVSRINRSNPIRNGGLRRRRYETS